jgi:hypothetical protein
MPTAATLTTIVTDIQTDGNAILALLSGIDPAVAPEGAVADALLNLFAGLAQKGLAAWSASAAVPITTESVAALLPNATPLSQPSS